MCRDELDVLDTIYIYIYIAFVCIALVATYSNVYYYLFGRRKVRMRCCTGGQVTTLTLPDRCRELTRPLPREAHVATPPTLVVAN